MPDTVPVSRHHYLPAAFIGGFSTEQASVNARDRHVWAPHHGQRDPVEQRASKLGHARNLYSLSPGRSDADLVDNTWSIYEGDLPTAVKQLVEEPTNSVDARTWLHTLVPFVTGLFVRGLDFVGRFMARLGKAGLDNDDIFSIVDSANGARVMEFQRLLAPVMAADWVVLSVPPGSSCISNDAGLVPMHAPGCPLGWAVSLRPTAVLTLLPTEHRLIAFHDGETWRALIERDEPDPHLIVGLNRIIARRAGRFIFGPTEELVRDGIPALPEQPSAITDDEMAWPFSDRMRRVHEFEWHRAISAIERSPHELDDAYEIDWRLIPFRLPVFMPDNLPEFRSGLHRRGKSLHLSMSHVPGFTDAPLDAPLPWDDDDYPPRAEPTQ